MRNYSLAVNHPGEDILIVSGLKAAGTRPRMVLLQKSVTNASRAAVTDKKRIEKGGPFSKKQNSNLKTNHTLGG